MVKYKQTIIGVSLTIAAGWLLVYAIFNDYGVIKRIRLKRNLEQIMRDNQTLETDNKTLAHRISLIKKKPKYIENIIRSRTLLVKNNEILYVFK